MVLAEILSERRIRKARADATVVARAKARQEHHAEWSAWVQRWRDAEAKGIPFDEPPPEPDEKRNRRAGKA